MNELKPTTDFYKCLLDNATSLIVMLSEEGELCYVNKAVKYILGYQPKEFIAYSLSQLIHPDDLFQILAVFEVELKEEPIELEPFRIQNKAGKWRWIKASIQNCLQDEQVQGYILNGIDITKQIEERRKEYKNAISYKSLFHNHPDAIFSLDALGYITDANSAVDRITKYCAGETLGRHFSEFIPAELLKEVVDSLRVVLSGTAQSIETKVYAKDGELIDLSIVGVPVLIDGVVDGVQCVAKDITAKKKQESQLELLSLVTNQTINGVVIMDCKGAIEWVNDSFTRLTGFTTEEVIGKGMLDVLNGPETNEEVLERFKQSACAAEATSCELHLKKKNGEDLWFNIEINPLVDDYGNLLKMVSTQVDITEQKKSQLELLALAKDLYVHNRDLQQSTYIISHNLRAPVANAVGLANLLGRIDEKNPIYRPSLTNLKTSVLQIDTILKDINLILSIRDSKDMVNKEEVKVLDVWRQAVQNLEEPLHHCGGEVTIEVDPGFILFTKKGYLHSIFYNLLSNAIKYRSRERTLKVHAQCYTDAEGRTVISFEDNGSGMDLEKVGKHLFKLYKRFHTYGKGRGIGLYLVKAHVEALDGHIEVSSQVNVGTKFMIYLN